MDIYTFIRALDNKKIYYELASHREGNIMVKVSVPGERWEIEFTESGEIEVETFKSNGTIFDEKKIQELFARYSD